MRSNGLATVLLMVPVLTVPALAIFGIPQFAPVVASPLDDDSDYDRDARGGRSSRHSSQDDGFGDVEEFGSESDMNDDPPPKKRKSSLSSKTQRSSRAKSTEASSWSDDLKSSDSSKLKRYASNSDEFAEQDSVPITKNPRKSLALEKSPREKPRPAQSLKNDEPARLGNAAEIDTSFNSQDTESDKSFDNNRALTVDDRQRGNELRRSKQRGAAEAMSWSAAVERLNQLEIRNFRLEPGRQLGQFVFICVYTPPDNPSIMHRFEAEAEQPLKAVENVLEQVAEWQQRR